MADWFFYPNVTAWLLGICCRKSVRLSFVTFVHPTQPVEIFRSFYTILYLSHPLTSVQYFTEIVLGELLRRVLNARGVAKCGDFGPVKGYVFDPQSSGVPILEHRLYLLKLMELGRSKFYGDRPREPLCQGLSARGVANYSDFGLVEGYISRDGARYGIVYN